MFNSTKNILRILIGTIIVILIVVIIVNLGNKSSNTKKPIIPNNGTIEHINGNNNNDNDASLDNDVETEDGLEPIEDSNDETLVDAPDTASTNTISLLLGSIVLTSGIIYIYRSNN